MAENDNKEGCGWICGVVEGFYGRPWTPEQRKELFRRMQKMGMNTYVYAPKDDLKHRAYWRDVYTVEEADHLQALIESAKKHGVTFYYALSPGLDIIYSNSKEISFLKQKLDQVKSLGCNAFALLFDDIEPTMSDLDRQKFSSFAQAQVSVTTDVYDHLGEPIHFMFCPTEYCESRAVPTLDSSEYLRYIGQKLPRGINVMWTGPRVISRLLTVDHLTRVSNVLRRRPLIWDNLHANDYDNKRIFIGPYSGRPVVTQQNLAGVVTNPNCEFEANYVAMHTLAYWGRCESDAEFPAAEDATLEAGGVDEVVAKTVRNELEYHPVRALHMALDDWLPEIFSVKVAYSRSIPVKSQAELVVGINTCASVTSTTSSSSSLTTSNAVAPFAPSPGGLPLYTPPVVAETIKNPFMPPPIIDPVSISEDPLLTPAMQAVNSLLDEYSEPMELGPATTSSTVCNSATQLADDSPVKMTTADTSPVENKDQPELLLEKKENETRKPTEPEGTDELMESKSTDNLEILAAPASFKQPQSDQQAASSSISTPAATEAMVIETTVGQGTQKETPAVIVGPADDGTVGKAREEAMEETQMQVDAGKDEGLEEDVGGDDEEAGSAITRTDIQLLAELFYLPFEHGPRAYWIIDEFVWLKNNGAVVKTSKETGSTELAEEWHRRAGEFNRVCKDVAELCRRLVDCPNRGLVYDFYPYVWDLQGVLNVLNGFIKWIGIGCYGGGAEFSGVASDDGPVGSAVRIPRPGYKPNVECEPWIFRGGLMGELQRLLPLESGQDLFLCRPPHPPSSRLFRARPYCAQTDRDEIYVLCKSSIMDAVPMDLCAGEEFVQVPELIGDWVAGSFLDLSPECCFVIEDDHKDVVGFALAARDSMDFYEAVYEHYLPKMRSKYPPVLPDTIADSSASDTTVDESNSHCSFKPSSLGEGIWAPKDMIAYFHDCSNGATFPSPHCVYSRHPSMMVIRLQSSVLDTDAPKRLMAPMLAALKSLGSPGVHGQLRRSDRNLRDLYCRLGFFEIGMLGEEQSDIEFLGRLL